MGGLWDEARSFLKMGSVFSQVFPWQKPQSFLYEAGLQVEEMCGGHEVRIEEPY